MDLVKLEKEIIKNGNEQFCGEVRGMTLQQVKDTLAIESQNFEVVVKAQDEDEELNRLKEDLKELKAPYLESKKAIKTKIRFLVGMLEEKSEV